MTENQDVDENQNFKVKNRVSNLNTTENDASDWEECSLLNESECDNTNCTKEVRENILNNENNYEIVSSDDEAVEIVDTNVNSKENCNWDWSETTSNFYPTSSNCHSPIEVIKSFLNILFYYPSMVIRGLSSFIRFIFSTLANNCITSTVSLLIWKVAEKMISIFSFKLIKKKIYNSRKSQNLHQKCENGNTNNNAALEDCDDRQRLTIFCIYLILIVGATFGFLGYCWFHPESKVCSLNKQFNELKLKLINIFNDLYILPGGDCMKAGRCCKSILEGVVRWIMCLSTILIRATLTAWPRSVDIESVDTVDNIRIIVERIMGELDDLTNRLNKMEELLLKIRYESTHLEKLLTEKSEQLLILEPLSKKYANKLKEIKREVGGATNQIKNIISIRDEADKVAENMKIAVRDSSTEIKTAISKMKATIDLETNRLQSMIEVLEVFIREDEIRMSEIDEKYINQIKSDVEHVKTTREMLDRKLTYLKNLPSVYKKYTDNLKEEVSNRIQNDIILHENMAKKTDCFCIKKLNDIRDKLDHTKTTFNCYVKARLDDKAEQIHKDVRNSIVATFREHTVDVAKATAEDALIHHIKPTQATSDTNVKGSSILQKTIDGKTSNIEDSKTDLESTCTKDATLVLDFNRLCLDNVNKSSINDFNDAKIGVTSENTCLTITEIKDKIKIAITRYSADKVGLADFAMESMGASVVPDLSSSTYLRHFSLFTLFLSLNSDNQNSLRTIIQPHLQVRRCWPFKGSQGYATIKLSHKIMVKAVTIDHLSKTLSPDNTIASAPKSFTVSATDETGNQEELLGTFEYLDNNRAVQTFWLKESKPARYVKLTVYSNHGNKKYTCIYRFRVHGAVVAT